MYRHRSKKQKNTPSGTRIRRICLEGRSVTLTPIAYTDSFEKRVISKIALKFLNVRAGCFRRLSELIKK